MSAPSATAGTMVADRYRLDHPAVGVDGGFSATDSRLERDVMVRLFPVDRWSAEERARFQRDVKTAARLAHANVAGVLDFGSDAEIGADFVVTETLRGEQLATLLAQRGTPPFPFALRVLQEAAAGVGAGHRAGIVHGELHPGTLFLSRGEEDRRVRVRVTGFGARGAASMRTAAARYAAPEALRRGTELTPACDVFSLGVVALELLAGLPAAWGATLAGLVRGQPTQLPSIAELRPDLPAELAEAVQRALAPDAAVRFPDAAALAEALGRVPVPSEARVAPVPAAPEPTVPEPTAPEVTVLDAPPVEPAPAAPAIPVPPPPATPDAKTTRVAAPGWKIASATDLGDHLYIPPALLDGRKPAAAAAGPAPEPSAVPAQALASVPVAPRAVPVAAPVPPAVRVEPAAEAGLPAAAPVPAPAAAAAPSELAAPPARAEAEPVATMPVRVPRLGAQAPRRSRGMLMGGGAAALLVAGGVAFAAMRSGTPAAPAAGAALPAAQHRLAASLPTAQQPTAQVASSAETRPQPAEAAAPPADAADRRAEEARRLEAQRKQEEARQREEARRLAAQQRSPTLAGQPVTPPAAAPTMRQVAVPVAPPPAQPDRPVAATAVVARTEPAEVRPPAPAVDPNRVYGPGEVGDTPDLTNGPELARELQRSYPMSATGSGRVVLGFVVLENGRVDPRSVDVVSSTAVAFNGPARRVVARARFQPGTIGGRPVKVRVQLPLSFEEQD